MSIEFPEKAQVLFDERPRYIVLWGGRGSSKSWSIARALLLRGAEKPHRILCGREFQNSITESVHKLLATQIEELGLSDFYTVQNTTIFGKNGTEFIFSGLRNNPTKLKSYEGISLVWLEEAQTISKSSWEILVPTIRLPGSQIIISFNPLLAEDFIYQQFVAKNPPPNSIVQKMNFDDNPWFGDPLITEMLHMKEQDPDSYLNVWLGNPRQTLDGAVYARELREAVEQGRITRVPYDPTKPVDTAWDLGWADHTCIWFAQTLGFEYRIIDYLEGSQRAINDYLKLLQEKSYVWGRDWLPHDAQAKQLGSGKSIEEIMRAAGRRVNIVPRLSVEDGINAARTVFPNCWFDEEKCADGLQALRHYRYEVDEDLGTFKRKPLHDAASHGCLTGDSLVLTESGLVRIDQMRAGMRVWTPCGCANVLWAGRTKTTTKIIRLVLDDGRAIECTPEHKIATTRGFVQADALRYSDKILSGNEWQSTLISLFSKARNIGFRETTTAVTCGGVVDHLTSTVLYGKAITGLYQGAVRFITETVIPSIIPSRTLSASMHQSISVLTPSNEERLGFSKIQMNAAERWQQNGTVARKGGVGTRSMVLGLGTLGSGIRSIAINVASRLLRLTLRVPSGATSTVKWKTYVNVEEGRSVYDLTVENHACYQANGILVSNSDAFRYLAVSLKPRPVVPADRYARGWRPNRGGKGSAWAA